eukprot:scaffold96075_cov31-Tisochrysis_lutea.AAC.13
MGNDLSTGSEAVSHFTELERKCTQRGHGLADEHCVLAERLLLHEPPDSAESLARFGAPRQVELVGGGEEVCIRGRR